MTLLPRPQSYAPFLWLLLCLFCLRVLAHLLVVFLDGVAWLPPEEEWLSGVLGYQYLLVSQIVIVLVFGKVCVDFTRGQGYFVTPHRFLASWLPATGLVYLCVMVVRYIIRMSLYSPERWTGVSIPIFFHCVLAFFILIVALHQVRAVRDLPPLRGGWRRWVVRGSVGVLVAAGVLAWLVNSLAPWFMGYYMGLGPPQFSVRAERGVGFTTSTGIELVANVYHPRRAGLTPTILVRVPYTKAFTNAYITDLVSRVWAERGYTVVFQGTRGRGDSGGVYDPLRPERQDGLETLNWLSEQPWFDGRLGMWGGSYFGYTQWVLANEVDPGPSALGIQIASTDFYSMFYPGGAFSLESALHWALTSRPREDVTYTREEMEGGVNGFPLIKADDRALHDIPYFNDWVSHPERDYYWQQIDGEDRIATLQAPIHLMSGWFDPFLPTQLEDFIRIQQEAPSHLANETRLVIGPWAHARTVELPGGVIEENYRTSSISPSVAWFDRHLKGLATEQTAPVRIYVMGDNIWRDEHEWPLARTQYSSYYLASGGRANTGHGDGKLFLTVPKASNIADTFVYNPLDPVPSKGGAMLGPRAGVQRQNDVEGRDDVLVYTSPVLKEDVEVTGLVELVLHISTTAPSTDFTGKLVDVHPDGSAYYVSEGALRLKPGDLNPDGPTEISIDLWPTSMVFREGHRIRLEVSSSSYPRFDRNPNTGRDIATETAPIAATQTVSHGIDYLSRLVLPVIPR